MATRASIRGLKVLLWASALAPAAWIAVGAFQGWLGVNPIEKVTHVTGMTALILLLVTLGVTPVRRLTAWHPVVQLRRPLGLFAFFYAFLHFAIWMGLDLGFQLDWVWEDIVERPYITIGFTAFLLLIPLAITSTKRWIRRLGRRWTTLHRGVYLATGLGIIHFYWQVKADTRLPLLMAAIFAGLMAARIPGWLDRRRRRRQRAESQGPDRTPVSAG